jgi:ribonuclease M5
MKPRIKEVVIVEGKTDTQKLKKIFDVQTFETNGSDINSNKIELLRIINEKTGIILFLDPDVTGKKIRSQILERIPTAKNAYLSTDSRGVAEHKEIEIIEAFKNFFTQDKLEDEELT